VPVPASALALALAAAFVHALWNLILAGARDPEASTAVAVVVSIVAFAPVTALTWDAEWDVWPYLIASSALQLSYFVMLAAAYRRASLSLVYPISRGLAPVLVLLVGVAVLSKSSSLGQVVGVLLVGGGILLVRGLGRHAEAGGIAFGLAIAVCIATYTLVDKQGVQHAAPITYLELTMIAPSLIYAAGIMHIKGREALRVAFGPATLVAGLAVFGGYALVLAALQRASAASVAAVRETSVVIGVALAGVFLREAVGRRRLAGAALVVAGVAVISLA
jgi:drug/metabolite transporter (DMT)-like permease